MQKTVWMLVGSLAVLASAETAAQSNPAPPVVDQPSWARWQGRLSLGTTPTPWRAGIDSPAGSKLSSASLMGDYYFGRSIAGTSLLGGFRATSGVMFGARSTLGIGPPGLATGGAFNVGSRASATGPAAPYAGDPANETTTVPYLGVGYTGLSVRNGWSFNADLGLFAQSSTAAVRFGRSQGNAQGLDDAIRQMRMTPLLQLGVSYNF